MDGLNRIWLVGYSMGGNLVLKAAGEAGSSETALAGAIAVCPNIDPPQCVEALEQASQLDLSQTLPRELEGTTEPKGPALFPGKWDLVKELDGISWISEFDDRYTAPDGGYASGADYYNRAGARHVLGSIAVPTLIITAQDDPFIPYSMFTVPLIQRHVRFGWSRLATGAIAGSFNGHTTEKILLGRESDCGLLARTKVRGSVPCQVRREMSLEASRSRSLSLFTSDCTIREAKRDGLRDGDNPIRLFEDGRELPARRF